MKLIFSVVTCFFIVGSFGLIPSGLPKRSNTVQVHSSHGIITGLSKFFGVVTVASTMSAGAFDALAFETYRGFEPLTSSTVTVAESIKLLDMSMPSYDDVKGFKASVENVPGLSLPQGEVQKMGILSSQKKKNGLPASSVLPSMGKTSAKDKEESSEKTKTKDTSIPKYEF